MFVILFDWARATQEVGGCPHRFERGGVRPVQRGARTFDGFAIVRNENCSQQIWRKRLQNFQILSCGFHKIYDTSYYFYHMLTKCLFNHAVIENFLLKAALQVRTFRKKLSESFFPKKTFRKFLGLSSKFSESFFRKLEHVQVCFHNIKHTCKTRHDKQREHFFIEDRHPAYIL